ncbi:MAG: pyridoxal-phosphate dependent enzyme [Bacteroidetes bacterium]|nr:pyridoxal-phosphate dependent enzyme [Bacteroidota bacterium]
MEIYDDLRLGDIRVQTINDNYFDKLKLRVDVLRLDKIHPVVSGNKWFKLKYFLQQLHEEKSIAAATFGGAFSNHIIATAFVCNQLKIKCTGFVRGEEPKKYSPTLADAKALNMQLQFLSREQYRDKQSIIASNPSMFFIPEGGHGADGAKGAAEIVNLVPGFSAYKYIVGAVGTGTMMSGIANASYSNQKCIGISVMKNNYSLKDELLALVHETVKQRVTLIDGFHFGGYARYTESLIDFINMVWNKHQLPLDFVYTAKAMYALYQLAQKNYFEPYSNLLFIHSGGLQGNRSLKQKIHFDS